MGSASHSAESSMETATVLECESTVTDRFQTTVPTEVRAALKINKRDKLIYRVSPGAVVLTKADSEDPVLERFLAFMANDIANHPEHVRVIDKGLYDRIQTLVGHIDVDLNAPLSPDDE
jgi:antitoxin PrlF